MPSVAARILEVLGNRLARIRGQGEFENNMQGRIYYSRPTYDLSAEAYPAIFIARRPSGGGRLRKPGYSELSETQTIFDVVGIVPRNKRAGLDGENLLADMQRALEDPEDLHLAVEIGGVPLNLLSEELFLAEPEFDPPTAAVAFEGVAVGVVCTHNHKYGDPNHVEK